MSEFPRIDINGDHHIHTHLCNHASGAMEAYVLAAIKKGLQTMTFLEHLECGLVYSPQIWLTPELFTEYFRTGQDLKTKYAGQISVRMGVEIGWNPFAHKEIEKTLASFPFEHRGISCHFYFDGEQHLNLLSRREDHIQALAAIGPEKILTAYFRNLIDACTKLTCDKLCHLDAALRHLPDIALTQQHWELITELLELMRAKDIALEVNTSGYELRPHPYPAPEIIKLAAEKELSFIVGSDAHRPEQVGRYFERLT